MANTIVTYDPVEKVWHGPTKRWIFGKKGFPEIIYNFLSKNLKHITQISDDSGEIYTAERMLKAGISCARALNSLGIKKGDNVLSLMDNHHYMVPTWLGVVFIEAVLCPFAMTDNSVKEEISDIIDQIQPKLFVTSRVDLIDHFKEIFKNLNIDCPIYIYENKIEGCYDLRPLLEHDVKIEEFTPPKVKDSANDIIMLTLSSATTGKPKLINSTHMQLLSAFTEHQGQHKLASTNKPGWSAENNLALSPLYCPYTRVITARDLTIDEFLEMIEKHKIGIVIMKPKDIFAAIRSKTIKKVNLSCLKFCATMGQHLSHKIATEFQGYIRNAAILNMYATSDVGITISTLIVGFGKAGSVGKINQNVSVRVVNEEGQNVGPNELGELYVTSKIPFAGYYKNEKLTAEAMDKDKYYHTGDMGFIDEEGNVTLVDRKKFLISYGGEFLNQAEIEKIVMDHIKGVEAVCVVDIEHEQYNVIPIIVIIPEPDAKLNEQEIIDTIHKFYGKTFFTRVFFVESMPQTLSGKFKKHLVREQLLKLMNDEMSKEAKR
uniref:CSON001932 protein n=1 Tax=Culicoides sonorensis TaxID=179676 RepID=A0A336MHT8_CULSO